VAVVWKVFTPKQMKVDVFRLELLNAMRKAGTQLRSDYAKTTQTWTHKVDFTQEVTLTGPGPILTVYTEDEIYGYVNDGTKPHPIFAGIYTGKSGAKALAFPGTFTAKTIPGVIGSGPGASSGGTQFRAYVQHPGTKARKFDEAIEKKWQGEFETRMTEALNTAAQKCGHSI
jgi:hypothetical protein